MKLEFNDRVRKNAPEWLGFACRPMRFAAHFASMAVVIAGAKVAFDGWGDGKIPILIFIPMSCVLLLLSWSLVAFGGQDRIDAAQLDINRRKLFHSVLLLSHVGSLLGLFALIG